MNYTARRVSARGPLQASGAQLLTSQPGFKIASTKSTCGTLIINHRAYVLLRYVEIDGRAQIDGCSINCGLARRHAGSLSIFGCALFGQAILAFSDFASNPSREKKQIISRHLW